MARGKRPLHRAAHSRVGRKRSVGESLKRQKHDRNVERSDLCDEAELLGTISFREKKNPKRQRIIF